MHKHESKQCPRCGEGFECRVGDVANCQCSAVVLTQATRAFLQNSFYDCLCRNCLAALNRLTAYCGTHPFPPQKELMVEGLHYYTENGLRVFTGLYHLQRGTCCESHCRHCAYGFEKHPAAQGADCDPA